MDRKAVERLKIFGDETRLKIIKLLASNTIDSLCVNDLANYIGISQQAASQHLKVLRTARILDAEKQGNQTYYTFNQSALVKHKQKIDFLFGCVLTKCNYLEEKE